MKTLTFIGIIVFSAGFSMVFSQKIPKSNRSIAITNKLTPILSQTLQKQGFRLGAPIYIQSFKTEGVLEVWMKKKEGFRLYKSFPICTFGSEGLGPKLKQGDGKAPEGFYSINPSSLNPFSSYHLSMNLGYPNQYDKGHKRTGNYLMVHGECVSIGCYAMANKGIEEIYLITQAALKAGQKKIKVHLFPFKMTQANMDQVKEYVISNDNSENPGLTQSELIEFWENLKLGYDWFYDHQMVPPKVKVVKSQYQFLKP